MLKIGILTFHASHNYGSMLQAFALQNYLESIGHKVEIINLRNEKSSELYPFPFDYKRYGKKNLLTSFKEFHLYSECIKWFKFERFLSNHYHLSKKRYTSWSEIKEDINNLNYDVIITGGDQIWNMRCKDFDESYFLPDQLSGIKKMSYCPSMGRAFLSLIDKDEVKFIKSALSDYNIISVREKSMQVFLSEQLQKEIKVVVDPTLLIKKEVFDTLIGKHPLVKGKYIFYYSPFRKEEPEEMALKIGKETGLPVIASIHHNPKMQDKLAVGPCEFLNLIRHAEFTIGSSFHLVIFSLIYHKNFLAVNGKDDNRVKYFLGLYGLEKRGDFNSSNCMQILTEKIDFTKTDSIMEQTIMDSQSFLEDSLKSFSKR